MENNEIKFVATQSICAILTSQMYMVKHISQFLFTVSEQLLLAPQFILWIFWFNKSMYTNHSSLLFRKYEPTYTILPDNHSSLLLCLLQWATDNQVCIVLSMQEWIQCNSCILTNHEKLWTWFWSWHLCMITQTLWDTYEAHDCVIVL